MHSAQEVSDSLQKELWTTAQAAVFPVKGCYQDPLFASGIRPPVVVCGSNVMRVYHVPMHTLWGCRIVPDLVNKSSRVCAFQDVWGFVRYLCCIRDKLWVELTLPLVCM